MRVVGTMMISVCMVVSAGVAEQRRVLAELFTGTWCPNCPYAEAAIDSLAQEFGQDSLVVLQYHYSDPYSISEGENRMKWYFPDDSVLYFPNMWFDGTINVIGGGIGLYNTYRNYILNRLNVSSPLVVEPDFSIGETKGEASVRIKVVQPFSEDRLKAYFVLYENEVDGEYHYVVRDILPLEDLAIASVGDSVEVHRNFDVDSQWHIERIGIGIFVQSESSQHVLQAARVELWMVYPNLSIEDFSIYDSLGNGDGRADPGDTVEMSIAVLNYQGFQDADSISLTLTTDDPNLVLLDSVALISHIPAGSTESNQANPFKFHVLPCSSHWANFQLAIHAQPNDYSKTEDFQILIGRPSIIVVDDDQGADYEKYYFAALDSLGVLYDCSNWLPLDPYLEIQKYEAIIWFTGDDSITTLTQEDIDSLSSWLDNGGKLFITGQNIGYDIGSDPFYSDYLHSQFVSDHTSEYGVIGVDGDPIGDGLTFSLLDGDGAGNQTSRDVIFPRVDADSCFAYRFGQGICGVHYANSYKIVYLSFGFEGIYRLAFRRDLMGRVLKWFGYPVTQVTENTRISTQQFLAMRTSPNPFRSRTAISYSLSKRSPVNLRVYDSSGRWVQTLVDCWDGPGISMVEWNGRDFRGIEVPSGTYFLQLQSPYGTSTRKLVCIR